MYSLEDFVIAVYCTVVDAYRELRRALPKVRRSGPSPVQSEEETITLLLVGEFLGIGTDRAIHTMFRQYPWNRWFPRLGDRSTFARQGANLWVMLEKLHERIVRDLGAQLDSVNIVDGFPIELCVLTRASRCKRFRGKAAHGFCASKNKYFYGFKGHLLISSTGVILGISLTAANLDERLAVGDFVDRIGPLLLGDKGYLSARFKQELRQLGITLWTAKRSNMGPSEHPKADRLFARVRRKIETVIGQLTQRLGIEKVWARKPMQLTARINRKILAHTVGMWLLKQAGIASMQLERLFA